MAPLRSMRRPFRWLLIASHPMPDVFLEAIRMKPKTKSRRVPLNLTILPSARIALAKMAESRRESMSRIVEQWILCSMLGLPPLPDTILRALPRRKGKA